MSTFLNSFYPLCSTKKGCEATQLGLLPFIDGSIRREPDFENAFPAITGLCRTNKLLPRLSEGDKIIYITNKGLFYRERQWCMVGILEVVEMKNSHVEAADFYKKRNLPVSQNLIVAETQKKSLEETHQANKEFKNNGTIDIDKWDNAYRLRAKKYPRVAICRVFDNQLYLSRPPAIDLNTMLKIFNRVPGTQTPPEVNVEEEKRFFNWLYTLERRFK